MKIKNGYAREICAIFSILFLVGTGNSLAQNFEGELVYQFKSTMAFKKTDETKMVVSDSGYFFIKTDGHSYLISTTDNSGAILITNSGNVYRRLPYRLFFKQCNYKQVSESFIPLKNQHPDSIIISKMDTSIRSTNCDKTEFLKDWVIQYNPSDKKEQLPRTKMDMTGYCTTTLIFLFNYTDNFPFLANWRFGSLGYNIQLVEVERKKVRMGLLSRKARKRGL